MYARGNNVYGQQPYAAQSVYGKNIGSAYPGSSLGGSDGASQLVGNSRHSAMLTGSQEADIGAYRAATSHYGGQYASVYGSTVLTGGQQAQSLGSKGVAATSLENRGDYTRGDYLSSNMGYAHKAEQFSDKAPDYASNERIHYGREFQNDSTMRYVNSTGFANQHKALEQGSLLRKEELLKQQTLQSVSIDAGNRQGEYFSSRGPTLRHSAQDLVSNYGGRLEVDPRVSAYGAQQPQSILGAAPRRGVDDLVYPQGGANSVYGVSLPPGRDYAVGKGILGTSLEADAPSRGGLVRIDEHKGDRVGYGVEMELREEERRREHMREREKEREREDRERDARAREREREREHDRRREREREREREHDRERARERERMLDMRDRNRDLLAHKLISDARHERSPLRPRDYRGSSLSKDVRMPRRDSPHHQPSHRRHSPGEDKWRDYICKVYSSRLNDCERDFLAVDKRFPRLFISPELSKVVVHWPKENLKLSIRTPVSFEHDFVEERSVSKKEIPVAAVANNNSEKLPQRDTVWNAKIILMSGLSKNSIEALSSEKILDGRIPHICNILRFAVLKNDHSLKAIGGPWNVSDGEDPSVDGSSLIQTARRYLKQIAQLDLQDCAHWNRFLEIHYDRAGDDGIFTHKEVTVIFVPDLSECVPSIDLWRTQWLQHKKDVANREMSAKNKKSRDHKSKDREVVKGKDTNSSKSSQKEEKKESTFSEKVVDVDKTNGEIEPNATVLGKDVVAAVPVKDKGSADSECKGAVKVDAIEEPSSEVVKPGKKVVKRVIKRKASAQKTDTKVSTTEDDKSDAKNAIKEVKAGDIPGERSNVAKASIPNKAVGEKLTETAVVKEDGVNSEELEGSEKKAGKSGGKPSAKKKIIKKIVKKKTPVTVKSESDGKADEKTVEKTPKSVPEAANPVEQELNSEKQTLPLKKVEENDDVKECKEGCSPKKKEAEGTKPVDSEKHGKGAKSEPTKEKERSKEGRDEKPDQSKSKEKQFGDPPKHPGFIVRTKANKESKLFSLSLSLDSLLDYSDKDVEESTFEVSLFAESLNEMLQYQMGCRLLSFLEKVRLKFSTKRKQRKKRQAEATEKAKESAVKRLKTSGTTEPEAVPSVAAGGNVKDDKDSPRAVETESEKGKSNKKMEIDDTVKVEEVSNPQEEPEEEEEVSEEEELDDDNVDAEDPMEEEDPEEECVEEEDEEDEEEDEENENAGVETEASDKVAEATGGSKLEKVKEEVEEEEKSSSTAKSTRAKDESKSEKVKKRESEGEKEKKKRDEAPIVPLDKEVLQAFRFFDRNRIGYIRVEDMRAILHNLGMFLSHREVKELVQSALLESNTGRDDRILYSKLLKLML